MPAADQPPVRGGLVQFKPQPVQRPPPAAGGEGRSPGVYMDATHLVLLCTCPSMGVARRIPETLIDDGAAACVNGRPGLTSSCHCQGETHADPKLQQIN